MKDFLRKIQFVLIALFAISLLAPVVSEVGADNCNLQGVGCPPTILDSTPLIYSTYYILLAGCSVIFFILLIIVGYQFIASLGDPDRVSKARKSLLFSFIGLATVYSSFFIVALALHIAPPSQGISISQNGGQLAANVKSSFTATPLPLGAVDNQQDTPIPPNTTPTGWTTTPTPNQAACGASPRTYPGCFVKLSEWYNPVGGKGTAAEEEYQTYDTYAFETASSTPASFTMIMNADIKYMLDQDDAVEISNTLDQFIIDGLFNTASPSGVVNVAGISDQKWTDEANAISTTIGLQNVTWQANGTKITNPSDFSVMDKILNAGYPVFALLQPTRGGGHVEVVIDHKNGLVYVADPGSVSREAYKESDWIHLTPLYYMVLRPTQLPAV